MLYFVKNYKLSILTNAVIIMKQSSKQLLLLLIVSILIIPISAQSYKTLWNKVSKAQEKGLPSTANETITQIMSKAKEEGNLSELLKALNKHIQYISSS